MKRWITWSFSALILFGVITLFSGCDIDQTDPTPPRRSCETNDYGWLKVTNNHYNTRKVLIDGTNYGWLNAGESKKFRLASGYKYWVEITGPNNRGGCRGSWEVIQRCQTNGISCRH